MEQVLQQVEKAPIIVAPIHAAPMTPAEAAKGHSTTTMEFPKEVHLTVSPNSSIFYPKGIHEVPDHLAGHWYLEAHQVRPYYKPVQVAAQPQARPAQQQQQQQNSRQQNNGRNQRQR
jgi:hypothetical protein